MTASLWCLVAALAWWTVRAGAARRRERAFVRTHRFDRDGIIEGAEPIHLAGTRAGAVLLLHGFNDSPQSMRSVAEALHAHGWSVRVPLLPGHGRQLEDWAASDATAWERAARDELAALRTSHAGVAVGGLSMGGALAFVLAAEQPGIRAVVGFAPYLHAAFPLGLMQVVAPVVALGPKYLASGGEASVHDPVAAADMIAYRVSTPRLVVELEKVVAHAREALPRVMQPVLVVQSRQDNRIPASSAEASFALIGARDKTLHWTAGNGHVVTVDYGHEAIEQMVCAWLDSRLP